MTDTLINNYLGAGVAASRPGSPAPPTGGTEIYYETDTGLFKCWSGSAWVTINPLLSGGLFAPVMSAVPTHSGAGYTTWDNQSSAAVADNSMGFTLTQGTSVGSHKLNALTKAVPSTPYTAKALILPAQIPATSSGSSGMFFGWANGATGGAYDGLSWLLGYNIYHSVWASATSNTSFTGWMATNNFLVGPMWLLLTDNGTTVTMAVSFDGVTSLSVYSVAKSSGALGSSGYSYLALATDAYNSPSGFTVASYAD